MFHPQGVDAPAPLGPHWLAALADAAWAESQALLANSESLLWDHAATAPEQLRGQLSTLRQVTADLQRYVQNVLLLTAFRREGFRFQLQPTDLDDWLDEVLPALRSHVAGSGHALRVVRRGALPEVMMDRHHITHALINLLARASAGAASPHSIGLTVAAYKQIVRVAVVDSGPGLQEPVPENGFAAAVRVPAADGSCHPGASLGLALAQATIEAHGGQTRAANCQGGGAIFWFELMALGPRSRLA